MNLPRSTMTRMTAVVLATVTLSACAPTPTPSPTPTAAFASEEEAFAAAEETYRAYNDAYNRVNFTDPATFAPLDDFTSGTYRADEREGLTQLRAEGVVRSGEATVVWFRGIDMNDEGTIEARVCKDLSAVEIRDAEGNSLVSSDRPDYSAVDLTFITQRSKLFIVDSQAVTDETCARS